MADEKAIKCYGLAKAVEKIDCALEDVKTTVLPQKEMRQFNGVSMSLYALQLAAKEIGNALPEMKPVTGKLARRARDLAEIVRQVATKPVPKEVAEFIREDLGPLWAHQRALLQASEKACLNRAFPVEMPKERFQPIPAEVKKAAAKVRKELDAEIAKRNKDYQRSLKRRRRKKGK